MKKKDIIDFCKKLDIPTKIIELVLMKVTGLTKSQLFQASPLTPLLTRDEDFDKFKKFLDRFGKLEPIQYILNKVEFYGLEFYVDNRVLIPRDDTEVLVSQVIESLNQKAETNEEDIILIDVGVGSAIIPITLVKNLKGRVRNYYGIDISKDSLDVAKINVEKHGLQEKIELMQGDLLIPFLSPLFLPLSNWKKGVVQQIVITANLPYIKQSDFENMDKSVIIYEPYTALYGGKKTGFELYEKLIDQAIFLNLSQKEKKFNVILFIEIGFDQYEYSKNYLEKLGLKYKYFKDTAGVQRCIKIEF